MEVSPSVEKHSDVMAQFDHVTRDMLPLGSKLHTKNTADSDIERIRVELQQPPRSAAVTR